LIGVFGGTFDPPHLGHLILADEGRWLLALEKVLWVVTAMSPLKDEPPGASVEQRTAMVEATIASDPAFELSRADIDRPLPHYALGTLEWLKQRIPGADFAYLMGADSLRDLPAWHEPERFVAACACLGVMQRPGVEVDMRALSRSIPGIQDKVRFFNAPGVGFSAQEIRRRVRAGEPYRHLVPLAVASIIEQQGIYR
jgi:nicotinate-nucleotide adenylyltransferase